MPDTEKLEKNHKEEHTISHEMRNEIDSKVRAVAKELDIPAWVIYASEKTPEVPEGHGLKMDRREVLGSEDSSIVVKREVFQL